MENKWAVTYQFHDGFGTLFIETVIVQADCIGQAINVVDKDLDAKMEAYSWDDYNITNACFVPVLY